MYIQNASESVAELRLTASKEKSARTNKSMVVFDAVKDKQLPRCASLTYAGEAPAAETAFDAASSGIYVRYSFPLDGCTKATSFKAVVPSSY